MIFLKIRDETVISCKFNSYHTGMERFTEIDMSESFLSIFIQLLQYSRQCPSFSAYRAALITKSALIFPAFFLRLVVFAV